VKPPFTIKGLDHVVLRVRSLPEALRFYRDILGCPIERTIEELGLTQLRAGASLIDLVPADSELGRKGGSPAARTLAEGGRNVDHFCLLIADFDAEAVRRHLIANGIAAGAAKRRYGAEGYGPSIYVTDPDGNIVELKGPSEAA